MGETLRVPVDPEQVLETEAPRSGVAPLRDAVERASRHLLSLQSAEGYWLGELQADTTLESDYLFYLHLIGDAGPDRVARLARYVRRRQLADGGWNIYEAGPSELNATIKAYVALRLAGDPADIPHLSAAARRVRALGGIEASNSFTRFYLALGGLVSWDMLPVIPPELMLLPGWSVVNLYEMSSWTRGIVVPLTILYALRPRWSLPGEISVHELLRDPSARRPAVAAGGKGLTWRRFFLALDSALRLHEKSPVKPFRRRAVRKATQWMMDHLERSDGLAAIYPAMMNCVFALLALGRGPDDPVTARQIQELARFEIEDPETIRLQPCLSPVWDTAIAVVGLREAGLREDHPSLARAAAWLLDNQILGGGDWQIKNRDAEPGGWAFEFRNEFYPDVDDTAFVLMALQGLDVSDPRAETALRRGVDWLASMQNRDGGWAAFDRDNDRQLLTQIPFADHNAMIDPSTADVTARVVECLARFGRTERDAAIQRGIRFLRADQKADGSWYGRWGVNYVYGTGGVLRALGALGLAQSDFAIKGADWLESVQNSDGGFGETCRSYDDPRLKGKGPSTASQTAWALIGLLAVHGPERPSVVRAVRYLTATQKSDGSWDEEPFTGTGFPQVFYLKYHLYRDYFPLYALARFRALAGEESRPDFRQHHAGLAIQ